MRVFHVKQGSSPLILAFPHMGTCIPKDIAENLNATGKILKDTDWHIEKLYQDLIPDATLIHAYFHRYVIDANRDPDDISLYPLQNTTGLVPHTDFDGKNIWYKPITAEEVESRKQQFYIPYHQALQREIERISAKHGYCVLYDCHSIRSHIPFLFEGKLPDLNIGSNDGQSANAAIEKAVVTICQQMQEFEFVVNGRFKGGYTTRHYGQPENNIFAIQMELAQSTYLKSETKPFAYNQEKAKILRQYLKNILLAILAAAKAAAKA